MLSLDDVLFFQTTQIPLNHHESGLGPEFELEQASRFFKRPCGGLTRKVGFDLSWTISWSIYSLFSGKEKCR